MSLTAVLKPDQNALANEPGTSDITVRLFWLFALTHLVVWTALSAVTQPNAPLDMIEMLFWGHAWELGYYKHPPLPSWTAEAVAGLSLGLTWPIYLVAQLAVVTSFWAAWRLAREVIAPWPALCAAMLLESCYYYNFTTADINNTIVCRPFWSLAVLFLYWSIQTGRYRWWLALGVCLGLGMLSKYYIAVLIIAMLFLPLVNREVRRTLRTAGPYLATAVALLLFSAHVLWMIQNDFITIRYVFDRSEGGGQGLSGHLLNPLAFLFSQTGAFLPILLLAVPLTGRWRLRTPRPEERLQRDFLLTVVLGPVALYALASFAAGAHIRSMWGGPLCTFVGVLILFLLETRPASDQARRVAWNCVTAGIVLAIALVGRNVAGPYVRGKPSRVHFPGQELAAEVNRRWLEHHSEPLPIVAGPWWPAANVGYYLPGRTAVYGDLSTTVSPWADDDQLRRRGGVVVWETKSDRDEYAASLQERFPSAKLLPPVEIEYRTGADLPPARFGLAIVEPGSGNGAIERAARAGTTRSR